MPFNIKKRGKLTYYYEGNDPVLSNMVVETLPDGDLRICFSGLTGGYSATGILSLDDVAFMEPEIEIPLVFQCWERWLQEAAICDSIADIDFIEMHAFATQPKSPNPQLDPVGYQAELERLRSAVVVPKIWTPSRESILVFQHEEKPQWGSREDLARSSKQV